MLYIIILAVVIIAMVVLFILKKKWNLFARRNFVTFMTIGICYIFAFLISFALVFLPKIEDVEHLNQYKEKFYSSTDTSKYGIKYLYYSMYNDKLDELKEDNKNNFWSSYTIFWINNYEVLVYND